MSKGEAILKIEPEHELRFKGPFKEPVSVVMKLTNTAEKKACFKVKTTAPKRYCVKPTTGIIDPKGTVTILVTLQPFDPNDPNEKGKHKFQVLSAVAPESDFNIETLWKDTSLEINDWKLKCVLDNTEETTAAPPAVPVANPAQAPTLTSAPAPAPIIKEDKVTKDTGSQRVNALESELKQASEEIKRLREEISTLTRENIGLKEDNVRQRRNVSSGTETRQEPPTNVYRPPGQDAVATAAQPNFLYIIVALLLGIIMAKIFF